MTPSPLIQHRAPLTIVTAFFALDESNAPRPDGRRTRDYHKWMANFLPNIKWPLVIFCDEQSAGVIKRLRGDKPAVYHITRLEEFSVYRHRHELRAHIAQRWPGFPADASLIYHEKANFVRRAIFDNPYQSEMFFWCDIGMFRQRCAQAVFQPSARIEWPNLDVCRAMPEAQAVFFAAADVDRKRTRRTWVLAALWGGRAAPMSRFCDDYYRCLNSRMRANPDGRAVPKGMGYHSEEAIFNLMSASGDFNMRVFTTDDIRWLRGLGRLAHMFSRAPGAASNPIVAPPPPPPAESTNFSGLEGDFVHRHVLLPKRRAFSMGLSRSGSFHNRRRAPGGKNHRPANRIMAAQNRAA